MLSLAVAALLASSFANPADDAAFTAFAQKVEATINAGDPSFLDAAFDLDAFAATVTEGVDVSERARTEFIGGMKKAPRLGTQLIRATEGGTLKLLRFHRQKGAPRALFRILTPGGVNYVDLHLKKVSKSVKVVDAFFFINGEPLSETMHRMFLSVAAEVNKSLLDRALGKEQLLIKHLETLRRMQQHLLNQEGKAALELFHKLPAPLKKERMFLQLRVQAAAAIEGDEYLDAIEDYEKAVPGNPSLDLISIDGHLLRKQHARAIATVDRLDAKVQDPYLRLMRGNIHYDGGDRARAKAEFKKAVAADKTMLDAYYSLIGLALEAKEYAELAQTLTALERDAGVELNDLRQVPEYAEFVQSKEYKAWAKARAAK